MKTICASYQEVVAAAADQITELAASKPRAVLAVAAGETMVPLFAELADRCQQGRLSLKDCRLFSVAEYIGAEPEKTCRHMLESRLVEKTDLQPENCVFLGEENLDAYDRLIAAAGGLDLAVLGLGLNAHIGFNEPATPFDSLTHRQKLTDATKRQKAARFGGFEAVPAYGLTMGIKTLVEAREILLLALGEEKAEAAFKMLYARTDSAVPAAFLQLPSRVTVYLDEAAGAKL